MSVIVTGIADVVQVIGTVFTAITGNPLLVYYLATGVLASGIGTFSTLRSAAH